MEKVGSKTKSQFNKEKWLPLCQMPFLISHYCCNVMKKSPLKKYQTANGHIVPYIATMAEESRMRKQAWIRHGCNAFDGAKKTSQPMSFWTEQDVLEYISRYGIELASVYGSVVCEDGVFHTTGLDRSGWQLQPLQLVIIVCKEREPYYSGVWHKCC